MRLANRDRGGSLDDLLAGIERQVASLSSRLDALNRAVKTHWILQPRVPRGISEGGQWTDSGAYVPAQAQRTWRDPWPRSPVPREFRELLHMKESRGAPNHGYGARHPVSGALGRYQLTPIAQLEAGLRNTNGTWKANNRFGARTEQGFLDNPRAQEEALAAYLAVTESRLLTNGSANRIGQKIEGVLGQTITVSMSGLVAAAHRYGPPYVRAYLDHVSGRGWRSDFAGLSEGRTKIFLAIETRLREFERVPHRTVPQQRGR